MSEWKLDLDAIRARADAATEGPWEANTYKSHAADVLTVADSEDTRLVVCEHAGPDAEFIAAARTDVPALLAEVTRLRAELDILAAQNAPHVQVLRRRLADARDMLVTRAGHIGKLERHNAELAAQIEQVYEICDRAYTVAVMERARASARVIAEAVKILATTPADALKAHDAEVAATALESFARKAQQDAVEQTNLIGFARVSLELLHAAAAECRTTTESETN